MKSTKKQFMLTQSVLKGNTRDRKIYIMWCNIHPSCPNSIEFVQCGIFDDHIKAMNALYEYNEIANEYSIL